MEVFFAVVITLILTSWLWIPVLLVLSPAIFLYIVGVLDSIPFRNKE